MAINGAEMKPNRHHSIEDALRVTKLEDRGLVTAVFSGSAFLNNWYYLLEKGTDFVQRNLGRSERAARILMEESMRLSNLLPGMETEDILRSPHDMEMLTTDLSVATKIPSIILMRHASDSPGNYFAISVQRVYHVDVELPGSPGKIVTIPTMYHGLRAVNEKERGFKTPEQIQEGQKPLHAGRLLTGIALLTHRGVVRYVHRTASGIAVWANMNVENLWRQSCTPYIRSYQDDPIAYAVVKGTARLLGATGSEIELTGVSRRTTPEPNRSLQIGDHPRVQEIQRFITEDLGARPADGDVVYGQWVVA